MDQDKPFMLSSYPRAILHVDGDAFFTSVEQAIHPHLKGKPVVSGKERGIIACASYEAKAIGIKRGLSLWDAKKICPDLVVLPSDYETYSLYSKRMFEVMRRYTPEVEEYSIDEGFADITGMRRVFRCSYKEIGLQLQEAVRKELDITVSVGLSVTKGLAKIASDFRKPSGITAVSGKYIHLFLQRVPLADIWGVGPSAQQLLRKYGVHTAYDFVMRDEKWIRNYLHKPGWEIWHELRGTSLKKVSTQAAPPQASISKGKTFSAASDDRDYIYAKLMRNAESAFIKLRRHAMEAKEISIHLRTKDYTERGVSVRLSRPTSTIQPITSILAALFNQLHRSAQTYRSTSIVLNQLSSDRQRQYDLFDNPIEIERVRQLGQTIDAINGRYGKHRIHAATGLYLKDREQNARDEPCWRKATLLNGETTRRRIRIPRLNIVI